MKKYCTIIFTCLLMHVALHTKGQFFEMNTQPAEDMLLGRVKQLNEFIERFNHDVDFAGRQADDLFRERYNRHNCISVLFNEHDDRLQNTDQTGKDGEYLSLIEAFIDDVVYNGYKIKSCSDRIYALTQGIASFNRRDMQISLTLKKDCIGGQIAQWGLAGIQFEPLIFNSSKVFIQMPPSSNETNFIDLGRISEHGHLPGFANGYAYDQLSVFYYLMASGEIKTKYTQEITYFLFDIPGWLIKVKEYIREGFNSGWLIDDLQRINPDEMNVFLRDQLHITRSDPFNPITNIENIQDALSLRDFCPEIAPYNGLISTTAWTIGYYTMGILGKTNEKHNKIIHDEKCLSPYYLQQVFSRKKSNFACDADIDLNEALYFLKHHGIPAYDDFPQECNMLFEETDSVNMKKFRIKDYDFINPPFAEIDNQAGIIRSVLKKSKPVPMRIRSGKDFLDLSKPLWVPGPVLSDEVHTIVIIGYDDTRYGGAFEMISSLGKSWGENGISWIRYEDIDKVLLDAYEIHL